MQTVSFPKSTPPAGAKPASAELKPLREEPQQSWREKSGKAIRLLDGIRYPKMRSGLNHNRTHVKPRLLESCQENLGLLWVNDVVSGTPCEQKCRTVIREDSV